MNLKDDSQLRMALKSSFALSAIGTGVLALGLGLILRMMERENLAFVQQSIGDTATLLGTQVELEVQRLTAALTEIGHARIRPVLANPPAMMDIDSSFLDVGLWSRADSAAQPVQNFFALNSRVPGGQPSTLDAMRLEPVFHGQSVIFAENPVMALIAVPLGAGEVAEVVIAHIHLNRLQKPFSVDGLVQGFLVDREGARIVGSPSSSSFSPLFAELKTGRKKNGQMVLADADGASFLAGYQRAGEGALNVIVSVPASQISGSLAAIRAQILFFLGVVFTAFFGAIYVRETKRRAAPPVVSAETSVVPAVSVDVLPSRKVIAALHGSLRGFNQFFETVGAEETTETLNDYFTLVAARVRHSGGEFEKYPGVSFVGTWDEGSMANALSCALALRQDLAELNESRKVDGKKPLFQGMGLHVGAALAARIGPASETRFCVTGEVMACARALDRLALSAHQDLLISHDVFKSASGVLQGKQLGETRLTAETGLTPYYSVLSYDGSTAAVDETQARDQAERLTSGETREDIILPTAAISRWLINNGTQMIGPFTSEEIATLLFSQELDFDSECWAENDGTSSLLGSAGVFTGSDDGGGKLWLYDAKTIHGPVSEGFVRTALIHGAITEDAFVCEGSTISGWQRVGDYMKKFTSGEAAESPAKAVA